MTQEKQESTQVLVQHLVKLSESLRGIAEFFKENVPAAATTRKRKRKDPNAPKGPLSSYLLFTQEQRPIVSAEEPNLSNVELLMRIGEKWRNLDDAGKKPYQDKAIALREQYRKDLEEFNTAKNGEEAKQVQEEVSEEDETPSSSSSSEDESSSSEEEEEEQTAKEPTPEPPKKKKKAKETPKKEEKKKEAKTPSKTPKKENKKALTKETPKVSAPTPKVSSSKKQKKEHKKKE